MDERENPVFVSRESGARLDSYLTSVSELSRARVQKLIEDGNVLVNSKAVSKNTKLKEGDIIEVCLPELEDYDILPEDIPLDIKYEDSSIIVINKPQGMVVHPAPGHYSGTLVNALMYHCGDSLSGIGGVGRPGIVHRIDRDTSGLVCIAKNDHAHLLLSEQLKDHSMHRLYKMIVCGNLKEESGTVDMPIGRHPVDRKKMAVFKSENKSAREAVTHWKVLERLNGFCYAEARLETGRTHQIRVHMSYIGHPLLGDEVYGGNKSKFEKQNAQYIMGQMLHAYSLTFTHPDTGEKMTIESELPDNFRFILEKLEKMT